MSEIKGWHYFISWDNPDPANSSTMLAALKKLGKVTSLQTKTSIALSPRSTTHWRDVRDAIKSNLNSKTGKAFYVNVRSGKGFEVSSKTNWHWKSAP